jgi:hypothetical protein
MPALKVMIGVIDMVAILQLAANMTVQKEFQKCVG